MSFAANTKLGPYVILSPLGAGGMGEVYRARDNRLDRAVAIKVLPAAMALDKERIARFEREAKVLATLNHPNIAAVYGFEELEGKRLLVMELAEGETLAERLSRGPLPIDECLHVARQVAEALEAAHEKGIIHRDLKPANVKITPDGDAKVLDFGLAKAMSGDISSPSVSPTEVAHSPTLTADFTRPGVILGTAAYMSPEQARGRSVDKRTDIFSFGCLLFECLSGGRVFAGETATDSIGAILHKEPEWALLPPNTPPTVHLLLRRCLAKDRNKRLRDIGDARIELDNTLSDPSSSMLRLGGAALAETTSSDRRGVLTRWLPWGLCLLIAGIAGLAWLTPQPKGRVVARLNMAIPPLQSLQFAPGTRLDISPDGSKIVYVGRSESGRCLYLRHLQQLEAVPLPNTDDAICPFFSPDGQWIAFGQRGKLRRISVLGGPATAICDAAELRGGSWGASDTIVFAPNARSGIWRVPAAGGDPVKLTEAGAGEASPSHRWPHFLPDGKTILLTATDKNSDYTEARILSVSLDSGEQQVIITGGTYARYVSTGHMVFGRSGTLMALPFDASKREKMGDPVPILEGVLTAPTFGGIEYAVSQNGTLVYVGGSAAGEEEWPVWIDRDGKESPISQHKRDYIDAQLSPDGTRLAAGIIDGGNSDIWILDIERDSFTRLTTDAAADQNARWTPDGKSIIFNSNRGEASFNLFRQAADGTGEAERLTTSENPQFATSVSSDGNCVAFVENRPITERDILFLRLDDPERAPETFLGTTFMERAGVFSPDGKWMTYVSDESGEPEVYVRPFLRPGAKVRISSQRGFSPRWSSDGAAIIYRQDDLKIMAVPLTVEGDTIRAGTANLLLELKSGAYLGPQEIAADGRMLFIRPADDQLDQSQLPTVVVNWFEELRSKVSATR